MPAKAEERNEEQCVDREFCPRHRLCVLREYIKTIHWLHADSYATHWNINIVEVFLVMPRLAC